MGRLLVVGLGVGLVTGLVGAGGGFLIVPALVLLAGLPMAAAMGSSIRYTSLAPAPSADSRIARRSTWVEPHGTQMMMRGDGENMRDS